MVLELGERLATGSRSAVFAWGHDSVVKVPFRSTPDSWIRFEAQYTDAVRAAGAPAPEFRGIELVGGREASVYERVHGRSMWEYMRERPAQVRAYSATLAELQVALFSLVAPVDLPALRDRLTCKLRAATLRVDRSLDAALDVLPPASALHLCHGDLHPGNVLMAGDGPVIIDWFDAARGDQVADVARTSLLISRRAHDDAGPRHLPGARPEVLDLARDSYLGAIGGSISFDPGEFRRWEGVVALARIAEGIASEALLTLWDDSLATSSAYAGASR